MPHTPFVHSILEHDKKSIFWGKLPLMLVNGVDELCTKISNQCHPVLSSAAKKVTLMQRTIYLCSLLLDMRLLGNRFCISVRPSWYSFYDVEINNWYMDTDVLYRYLPIVLRKRT